MHLSRQRRKFCRHLRLVEHSKAFIKRVKLEQQNGTKEDKSFFLQEKQFQQKNKYLQDLKRFRFVDPSYQFEVIWVVALIDKRKSFLPKLSLYLDHVTINPWFILENITKKLIQLYKNQLKSI